MHTQSELPKAIGLFDRILRQVSLYLGGATLVFMTGLSVWNVLIMRKALNAPIKGAEDILILSLVVIVALSIPLGARSGAHIEIEVLESSMSARFAKYSMIVMKLLGIVLLSIMSWQLFESGQNAARFGETTQQLLISYGPFYYLLSASIGIYAVVLVMDVFQIFRTGRVTLLKLGGSLL